MGCVQTKTMKKEVPVIIKKYYTCQTQLLSHHDSAIMETAEESTEPTEVDIMGLCQDMLSKMAKCLTGELTVTSEDYKLLENMTKPTSLKYLEMKYIAINISRNLKDLNQKSTALQPYLDQITLTEEQVAALDQAAYKLDAYSKKLEGKYKKLGDERIL
ncbi:biogenesis of lysosome-related organelles complex 1 subunit 2-like [Vombatus ursinus]|uniref:biogenesis of lysosome-related organelles complex 1 subunit 2-like n=1 Tax=Vombatus ursinus TaxID=29139 RepID=UPI000FFD0B15|nr:biogenesis of lysosome-related organelles complex 1 subunit 2-like [Vombatus ursinus]